MARVSDSDIYESADSRSVYLEDEDPPSLAWRFGSIPLLGLALALFLALVSYNAQDIPALHAPASLTVFNWLGRGGAHAAYYSLILFGLAAYSIPLVLAYAGILMGLGKRLGWKMLWLPLLLASASALAQFLSAPCAGFLSSPGMNIAPNAGGGIGYLLHNPGIVVSDFVGPVGSFLAFLALFLLFLYLSIGPRLIANWIRAERRRREEQIDAGTDIGLGTEPSDLEADDLTRRARRAQAAADRQARLAEERARRDQEAEIRLREENEARAARESERLRAKEERLAEKERIRQEKEAAKAAKKAEKEAARAARKQGEESIFTDDTPMPAPAPAADEPFTLTAERASAVPPPAPVRPAPRVSAPRAPAETPAATPAPAGNATFLPNATDFKLPDTFLLHEIQAEREDDNRAEVTERSRIIEDTLAEFGLTGSVTHVVCGPTITRFEVKPAPGVKVDRIQSVHSNLQMNLRAKSLRIISPIPGKDVVGIEVPNVHSRSVPLRGIAESEEWKEATRKMALPMLLARDIDGVPVIADLAKMPHMIVAGTTGSGKSVLLNSILSGWLLSRTPEQMRLILVDPKRVEFTPYADLPHLVVPVITDAPKVAVCLQWAVKEMDKRLKMFQRAGVRNIASYNGRTVTHQRSLFGGEEANDTDDLPERIPYIVIVVDEMSDLMMLAGADVEPRVVRLAQLARAVGIHLIIATQRPDVKVITGKIKANFPARIACKVASTIDSMTILDQQGAQSLIGRGDMLFLNPTSSSGLQRSQSAWIDDEEIAALCNWYRQQGEPVYVPDIKNKLDKIKVKDDGGDNFKTFESEDGETGGDGGGGDEGGGDAEEKLLRQCLEVIVSADRASTSMLQRKLRLGYNKAARIMDELEQRGCIGPANGAAPREILRTTLGPEPGSEEGAEDGAEEPEDDAGEF